MIGMSRNMALPCWRLLWYRWFSFHVNWGCEKSQFFWSDQGGGGLEKVFDGIQFLVQCTSYGVGLRNQIQYLSAHSRRVIKKGKATHLATLLGRRWRDTKTLQGLIWERRRFVKFGFAERRLMIRINFLIKIKSKYKCKGRKWLSSYSFRCS